MHSQLKQYEKAPQRFNIKYSVRPSRDAHQQGKIHYAAGVVASQEEGEAWRPHDWWHQSPQDVQMKCEVIYMNSTIIRS